MTLWGIGRSASGHVDDASHASETGRLQSVRFQHESGESQHSASDPIPAIRATLMEWPLQAQSGHCIGDNVADFEPLEL